MARRKAKAKKVVKQRKARPLSDIQSADQPTPEMRARYEYEFVPVHTEMNIRLGAAYRRVPLYVTMAKKADRFTFPELEAMRLYRSVFDRCERSPMSCALAGGGSFSRGLSPTSFFHATPGVVEAKRKLAFLERGLGHTLTTMRDLVLHDKSFSLIAMERFGSRTRSWIVEEPVLSKGAPVMVDGKPLMKAIHREDIVPRSGRDRALVSEEFRLGLRLLCQAVERLTNADVHEIWVHVRDDGSAIVHRATIAPNGTFRLWGKAAEVTLVLDQLLAANKDCLVFDTPQFARDALLEANDGLLDQLEPEELAV